MRLLVVVAMLAGVTCGCAPGHKGPIEYDEVRSAVAGRAGAFVMMDVESGDVLRVDEASCAERWPPCSTFKIWNTMIALELGLVSSPDEPFYTWDGEKRSIGAWNEDLTLGRAFAVSCVPAFQALADRIGPRQMQDWLDRIDYGDRDISAGVTEFWLPRMGRKTILISADEQAMLLRRLMMGELPFSAEKVSVLRKIMKVQTTDKGVLFGKTGSGVLAARAKQLAWFVGWVESGTGGGIRTIACVVHGTEVMGSDVRAIVEGILKAGGLL